MRPRPKCRIAAVALAVVGLAASCATGSGGSGDGSAGGSAGGSVAGASPAGGSVAAASPGAGARTGPMTPTDPARVPAAEAAAIVALGADADPRPPDWFGNPNADATHAHAHTHAGPATTVPLTSAEQQQLALQWSAAVAAAGGLDTEDRAAALGYVRAAANGPGVGVHWVKWSLVDAPFDPARPAMLLFDERREPARLAGFSYWVRSATAPDGFAGPNDTWHQHAGLCVVNGWVDREEATGPKACAGTYLAGHDLWMMHAWPVPGWKNRWGDFATLNPALCPANAGTPDISRCPDTFSFANR